MCGRWISAILLLCFAGIAGAQANLTGQPVAEVRLEGLEFVSESRIRPDLEVRPGVNYNPRAVARDIRKLYQLDFFATIKADASAGAGGVVVTYIFEEKRVIDEIKIIGNDKVRERAIRGAIEWREGSPFLPDGYDRERDAVLEVYQDKGMPNASVDILVEQLGAARVRVTYVIDEGRKARISDINFEGNEALTDHRLRRTIQTKKRFYIVGGKYDEDTFETDLQTILDKYGDVGRLEAKVLGTDFEYSDSGKNVKITVYLDEGPEYTVGDLVIAGNEVYDDDEVVEIADVQAGDVHNRSQVSEDADLVQKGYRDSGYIFARVTPQVTLDRDNHTTNITYLVEEGTLKYVREVKITGNDITRDEVIRRNILVIPGDRFDGGAIELSQRVLESMNYFEPGTVRFTREAVEDDDRFANLLIDVEEARTGDWTFGANFATDDGVGVFSEVTYRNFDIMNWKTFRGGGQNLNLRLNLGERNTEFFFGFTDPEIGGYPLSFGFDVFNESREYEGSDYTESRAGAQLRFAKILSPYVRTQMSLLYEDVSFSDVPTLATRRLREFWNDEGSTASIRWLIARDTIDKKSDPSSGSRHTLDVEVAGWGGDHDFYKIHQDSTWYWGIGEDDQWVASARTRAGWVNEYGDSDFVPLTDRFYAGGTSTVRGYESRDIGPYIRRFNFAGEKYRIGGEMRWVNNFEMKYKLTEQVRFYMFSDMAGVWEEASDFDLGDMKYSVGIGFGMNVPRLGPIRVDYGFPINPDEDQGSGRLHLLGGFRF